MRNRDFIKSRDIRLMGAFRGDGLLTAEGDLRVAAHAETMVALEGR